MNGFAKIALGVLCLAGVMLSTGCHSMCGGDCDESHRWKKKEDKVDFRNGAASSTTEYYPESEADGEERRRLHREALEREREREREQEEEDDGGHTGVRPIDTCRPDICEDGVPIACPADDPEVTCSVAYNAGGKATLERAIGKDALRLLEPRLFSPANFMSWSKEEQPIFTLSSEIGYVYHSIRYRGKNPGLPELVLVIPLVDTESEYYLGRFGEIEGGTTFWVSDQDSRSIYGSLVISGTARYVLTRTLELGLSDFTAGNIMGEGETIWISSNPNGTYGVRYNSHVEGDMMRLLNGRWSREALLDLVTPVDCDTVEVTCVPYQ